MSKSRSRSRSRRKRRRRRRIWSIRKWSKMKNVKR